MRRRGRVCALQILYQCDVAKVLEKGAFSSELGSALAHYWASFESDEPVDRSFTESLVRGVAAFLPQLDAALEKASHHWRLDRMDVVDRNLLRMAAYEITQSKDVPRAACINEAVEIAKYYCGQDAAPFINGILDHITREEASPAQE
jgi:N utilization substance protein B